MFTFRELVWKVKCSELIKKLKKDGCYFVRQGRGSHEIWHSPHTQKDFVVPNHTSKEIGKGLEIKIFKQAGL